MLVLDDEVEVFDVDGTLIGVGYDGDGMVTFKHPQGYELTTEYYQKHIDELKKLKGLGKSIIVWSHSGTQYAKNVVEALGLTEYVDVVTAKPQRYFDDEPCGYDARGWMGERIWLKKDDFLDE